MTNTNNAKKPYINCPYCDESTIAATKIRLTTKADDFSVVRQHLCECCGHMFYSVQTVPENQEKYHRMIQDKKAQLMRQYRKKKRDAKNA